MSQRVAYGSLAIAVLFALFVADAAIAEGAADTAEVLGRLLRRGSMLPLVSLAVFLFGAAELTHMLRLRGARPHARFAYLMTGLMLLTPWLSAAGVLGSGAAQMEGLYWQMVWMAAAGIGIGILAVLRGDTGGALRDFGATMVPIVYLGFLGSFGMQLRSGCDTPAQAGVWLLLLVVLVTKASDIGAYFVGSMLGRHRLAPSISPAKSIEGTVGGLLASMIAAVLLVSGGSALVDHAAGDGIGLRASLRLLGESTGTPPLLRTVLFGFCMSVAGQFGDLFESCFKRDAEVKDSGKVIPRFGGILDLVDSLVFAMPVAWFLLTMVWKIV